MNRRFSKLISRLATLRALGVDDAAFVEGLRKKLVAEYHATPTKRRHGLALRWASDACAIIHAANLEAEKNSDEVRD